MAPDILHVDHIHLPVPDRNAAVEWYSKYLGFRVCEQLALWIDNEYAPLFLENPSETVKLALFKTDDFSPTSAIAFGCSGCEFMHWKRYLEEQELLQRVANHEVCWSLYFQDVAGNGIEITSYDYEQLASELASEST